MNSTLQRELTSFGDLLDLIYQGATEMAVWHAVPNAICEWIDSSDCILYTPFHVPEKGGFVVTHNVSDQSRHLWETEYQQHDLWAYRAMERGLATTGNVIRDQDLATEEEFLTSKIYRELLVTMDVGRLLSGVIFSANDYRDMTVVCTCHRPLANPFNGDDATKMRILLPHLSRALGVMFRLRDAEFKVAASLGALDRLPRGILLFNEAGQVIFHNKAASRALESEDGLKLRPCKARADASDLVATAGNSQMELSEAIREAVSPDVLSARHFARVVSIRRPSGKTPYLLNFSNLPASNEFGLGTQVPRAIAFLNDDAIEIRLNASLLKSAYRLSDAEIRLAGQIVNGDSVEEAAQCLGVSVNTIKTQLGQIYDKTNTRNRAKLVKLLVSLAAVE